MSNLESARVGVVIVAAGSGQRFGDADKALVSLAGRPLVLHSIEVFTQHPKIDEIVVVAGEHTFNRMCEIASYTGHRAIRVCLGGERRSDSVRTGLRELSPEIEIVAVHDAARPLVRPAIVDRVIDAARQHGAAVPAGKVIDTLYRVARDGSVSGIEDRDQLRRAQTPQAARRDWLEAALHEDETYTDEGSALVRHGYCVVTVEGCPENIKITWPADLTIAAAILDGRNG